MNKNMVSSLISKYAQVVLWFCRTGLLPEGSGKLMLAQLQSFRMNPNVKYHIIFMGNKYCNDMYVYVLFCFLLEENL